MELEELKKIWKEHNHFLEKNISLNEQLLKNTFTSKASGEIESLLKWEFFSLIEFIVFLIFVSVCTYSFMSDMRFLVPGIFLIIFLGSLSAFSITSIKKLIAINLFSQSIVDTKQNILNYKKASHKFVKIFLFIIPPVIPSFILLGVRFIRNINLLDYPLFFTILSVSIVIISYTMFFISYQLILSGRFKIIENNLKELEKFNEE
ncbi:MAG: hypothetical protein WBV81_11930 [Ignavibacteriaceae bacterium]